MDCSGAWCVLFNHSGVLNRLRRRTLGYAYRSSGLFLSAMQQAGHSSSAVGCDSTLERALFDGTLGRFDDSAEVFYLATHGRFATATGYSAILHSTLWSPGSTGLGVSKLVVAVFDTCSLIDGTLNWQSHWQSARLSSSVRILLGFDGPAPCDRGSTERGASFARELLSGKSFADAWLIAVKSRLVPGTGRPVAIGVGDNPTDAANVLARARLSSMPAPRTTSHLALHSKY